MAKQAPAAGFAKFNEGDKVRWGSANKKGVVKAQFDDGLVSVMLDDGQPAWLQPKSLEKLNGSAKSNGTH